MTESSASANPGGRAPATVGPLPPLRPPQALARFPVLVELPVQWGDQDAFGHVNNVVFFRWIETSRIAYVERIGLMADPNHALPSPGEHHPATGHPESAAEGDVILAAVSCDYRQQVTYPDTIVIGARVQRIGNSSFTMEHALYSHSQQRLVAEGQGTVVYFDYSEKKSKPLPPSIREAIAKLQGET